MDDFLMQLFDLDLKPWEDPPEVGLAMLAGALKIRIQPQPDSAYAPEGSVAVEFHTEHGRLAQGAVDPETVRRLETALDAPVGVALAGRVDEEGGIDARILAIAEAEGLQDAGPQEAWKESARAYDAAHDSGWDGESEPSTPRAILVLGHAFRRAEKRSEDTALEIELGEMLTTLITGEAKDRVQEVLDDL